jgi:hypothetical protein
MFPFGNLHNVPGLMMVHASCITQDAAVPMVSMGSGEETYA